MPIDPATRLESANLALQERRLGRLYSVEDGTREGFSVEGVLPVPPMDRAYSTVMVIARRFGKAVENLTLAMHRDGVDHIASCIMAYFRHPMTGEIWFVTVRQKRLAFYFDLLSMVGTETQRATKGWTDEFPRAGSFVDLEAVPKEYVGCADHLKVTGLQPWMPPHAANDVKHLAARELGGLLTQPGVHAGDLEWIGRSNENSGTSAVFVHYFLLPLTFDDLSMLNGRYGGRSGKLSFHRYAELVDEARPDHYSFAFGQENHSIAALWKLEHSPQGERLGLRTSLRTHL